MGEGEVCVAVLSDVDMDSERVQTKRDHEWLAVDGSDTEVTEPCAKKQLKEDLIDIELVKGDLDCIEEESCGEKLEKGPLNEVEIENCGAKKEVKEFSNDDICSEVSNPNLSPRENASSFQAVDSQPVMELVLGDQGAFGEITSTCSGSSTSQESSSEEEQGRNDASDTVSTSHVVLEVPKHASTTTGIRKITFKFSKRKEDYTNQLPVPACQPMTYAFGDGFHTAPWLNPSPVNDVSSPGLHETRRSLFCPTNTDARMSDKVVLDSYPNNVKKLLSTRILDGAKVKYISASGIRELIGIIKDSGYMCGCSICNFSRILSAHEFEQHAGGKSRHPNNHIYLENGKPIYSIIQEIRTAPLSILDEVIKNVAGSSVNEELLQEWKANLQQTYLANAERGYLKLPSMYHSSYPSQMTGLSNTPSSCSYANNIHLEPHTYMKEKAKEQKRMLKKAKSYLPTSVEQKRSADGGPKKRDNDLHRLLFMPMGLPDGTDLAYYARGQKVLGGYKQGNGIVCSHCDTEISPSQFEAHAGWAAKRQPYRHICISSGVTLHDIALLLASGQSITTTNSDDMCAVCGDGGKLIICDGCPRAFHADCLGLGYFPGEDWHCPYCRDNIGAGRKAAGESRPIIIRLTRVVKAPEPETGGCVVCRANDFSVADFDDRTIMLCDQCEKEYHVGCLRDSGLCDLKELPDEKWFCCDHCNRIHSAMQEFVKRGPEVVPASVLSAINKKYVDKGSIEGTPNNIQWRILSGKSRYPEHLPLLSRAAAIFRECFDPIVAKSGRDLIPVMVYGRNISGQEFGGIYCVVLIVGSVVVSAGLLRIFGREVAELPLVATSRQNQGKGYFQVLFLCIEKLLLSLNVENLVLPAAEEAESIWTKKLGFRKMTDERYLKFSTDLQLTVFKGTSMLEKALQQQRVSE